jgi:hypothetical protein
MSWLLLGAHLEDVFLQPGGLYSISVASGERRRLAQTVPKAWEFHLYCHCGGLETRALIWAGEVSIIICRSQIICLPRTDGDNWAAGGIMVNYNWTATENCVHVTTDDSEDLGDCPPALFAGDPGLERKGTFRNRLPFLSM